MYDFKLLKMRHIHTKLVICAALAAVPLVLNVSTAAAETGFSTAAAYNSNFNMPLSSMPEDDIQVSGNVVDEEGNPLVGVTVVMQGTSNGTISDIDGNFSINVSEEAVLVFSLKGYYSQQIEVNGRSALGEIVMIKDLVSDEVQLAYRKVNKDDLIGSVSYVNMEEIQKSNYTTNTLDNMTSYVGGFNGKTIWGMNTDNFSYYVVVDGVGRGLSGVENLLPSEIETITFLKGADAVALYGSQAAKGAIIVNTKRGEVKEGLEITARVNTGFNVAKSFPEYLSSAEYMTYYNQAAISDGGTAAYSDEEIYHHSVGNNPYRYPNIDYYSSDYVKKYYNRTDANVELVGGSERARYYGAINYWTEGDYLTVGDSKSNRTNRYSVRGNVDININSFISAYVNSNATFYDVNTASATNWWDKAATQRPNRPEHAAPLIPQSQIDPSATEALDLLSTTKNIFDGKFLGGTSQDKSTAFGDMYAVGKRKYTIRKFQFDAGMNFNLSSILEGLSFKTVMGMDFSTEYVSAFKNEYAVFVPEWADYNGQEYIVGLTKEGNDKRTGYQSIDDSKDRRMINVTGMFDYTRSFGNNNINAMVIASSAQETRDGEYHSTCDAHLGFHVGYNFAHKYFVDFNSALVHTARLAEGHRNAFSPSVTIAWDLAKESFLQGSFIDKLQLEGSASILNEDGDIVAKIGDNNKNYYLYEGEWKRSGYIFSWFDGVQAKGTDAVRGENLDLAMIQRKEVRAGIRSSFLKGMFTFNGDFFVNDMDGYIVIPEDDYPSHLKLFVPCINNNVVRRIGGDYEFTFNKRISEVDFSFGIFGTYYTTTRTKYKENEQEDYMKYEGHAEDRVRGYKCIGIFQSQEEIDNSPTQGLGSDVKPGDLKYADLNGDGTIDGYDQIFLGKTGGGQQGDWGAPSVVGLYINAKWKNFTFFLAGSGYFEQYKFKNWTNSSYYQLDETDKYSAIARNSWSENNPTAEYPRISSKANKNNFVVSDFWMYSTDAFRLDKVQITYDLPQSIFGNSFVKGMSVYVMGANLLTISPQRELLELTVGNAPQSRYYGLGVKAKF